jgi:hypothetical protein
MSSYASRVADILQLGLISVTWAAATAVGLWLLKSQLPNDLRRRKKSAYPAVAQAQGKEIMGAGTEP